METAGDYERFVVDILKPQLASFVKNCEEITEEIAGYDEVKTFLLSPTQLQKTTPTNGPEVLGPLVDIGERCHVQSQLNNKDDIYIHIGMGFHVSLPLDEALPLIAERQKLLLAKLEHLQNRCQEIAAYINEILPIINELQKIEGIKKNGQ